MEKLVIKQHKPLYWTLVVVSVSVFVSLTLWLLMDSSHWEFIRYKISSAQEDKHLWEINRELIIENKALRENLNKVESLAKVDKETILNMQEEIIRLQNEIFDIKGELVFYKGIMDATRESKGLNIQGLLIEPLIRPNNYRYKLVLTHVTKSDKSAAGKAEILFEGVQDGKSRSLNLLDISQNTSRQLEYEFKNFKRLTGDFKFPEGFKPNAVVVKLYPKGGKLTNIDRRFDWAKTIN